MSGINLEKIRSETPGIGQSVHLLASGSSLMPQVVVDAVVNHTMLEAKIGGYEAHAKMSDALDGVYQAVAQFINGKSHEIALLENATAAWCHAFYALPLKPRSRILTCEAEYAANYVAFLQRAARDDLIIEVIPSTDAGALDLDALAAAMGEDVGLIAITWIPTNGGLVNPAAQVGKIARKYGVPYLLDACQAVGQLQVDVEELGCDFLSATGRKFLRGPRGTGFLYVRENWLETLEPAMIDHFGAPWIARDQYKLRPDARRFETWENSYALRAGFGAAVEYASSIGISAIGESVTHLADHCRSLMEQLGSFQLHDLGNQKCGIVSFTLRSSAEPDVIVEKMAEKGFVIGTSAPSSTRIDAERRSLPTVLRISPHYYNTEKEIEQAVKQLISL